MDNANKKRICTFCGASSHPAFVRGGRHYFKCGTCQAVLQAIGDSGEEVKLYDKYEEGDFSVSIEESLGDKPDYVRFSGFKKYLKPGKLLEIGPGTGHFLAAARDNGFDVAGVETSPYHRNYIRKKWNIETLDRPIEKDKLSPESFDNVVSFNCIEHISDLRTHFKAVFRVLKPGGRFLVVTQNSSSLLARFAGRYWAMFKPLDHLSLPSPKSLRLVGENAGLRVVRVWCSEFPLETPLGFVVALRDRLREKRNAKRPPSGLSVVSKKDSPNSNSSPTLRGLGNYLTRSKAFLWVSALTSHFMVAATVIALYEKPDGLINTNVYEYTNYK